jgi:AcrR family transcriptional regulator
MKQAAKTRLQAQASGVQAVLERAYPGTRAQLKRRILQGALDCFNTHGIEATTIELILARCDASVGNLYHHFGSKEGLVAALFFCALDDQAALLEGELARARTLREGVAAVVYSYVDWVTAQPELARFLFQARSSVSKGPHAQALQQRNRDLGKRVMGWFTLEARADDADAQSGAASKATAAAPATTAIVGAMKDLPRELLMSLIVGAAENYSRAWLAGRVKATPAQYRALLADAVWASVAAQSA